MKIRKLVFSFFVLTQVLILRSYGQDSINRSEIDTFIRSKPGFVLKRGIYKNYQEFLDNAPSVDVAFTITQIKKSEADLARGVCPVRLDVPKDKPGHIWGFCDGNAVYCKFSFLESKYWKLQYIGPYSFFFHVEQIRSPGGLLNAAMQDPVQLFVLNKKGKSKFASEEYLYKLFKTEPSVFTEFDKNPNRRTEFQRQFYLKKFNQLVQSKK